MSEKLRRKTYDELVLAGKYSQIVPALINEFGPLPKLKTSEVLEPSFSSEVKKPKETKK